MPSRDGKAVAHVDWRIFFKGSPAEARKAVKVVSDHLPTRRRRISIKETGPTWVSLRLDEARKYDAVVYYITSSSVCSSVYGGAAPKECFTALFEAEADDADAELDNVSERSRSPSRSLTTAVAECISDGVAGPSASAGPSAAAPEAVDVDLSVSVRHAAAASEAAPQSGPAAAAGGPAAAAAGRPPSPAPSVALALKLHDHLLGPPLPTPPLVLGELLGEGTFGAVHRATGPSWPFAVAAKVFKDQEEGRREAAAACAVPPHAHVIQPPAAQCRRRPRSRSGHSAASRSPASPSSNDARANLGEAWAGPGAERTCLSGPHRATKGGGQ